MPYVPRLLHAIAAAVLCVVSLALGLLVPSKVAPSLFCGAFLFGGMVIVIMYRIWIKGAEDQTDAITRWMHEFNQLDDEGRAAVAFAFPTVRYRMKRGEVREAFEDTNVSMELFRLFLHTSDSKYISPRRYWFRAEQPEWAWLEIKAWLEERNMIEPDSAAGSHSWKWRGNAWAHLNAYWGAGLHLRDMSGEHIMHAPGYTPPPQAEEVGTD